MRTILSWALRAMLLVCAAGRLAWGQQFVIPQPDCLIFFHFTATGQTSPTSPNAGLDNRTNGCTTWNLSFTSVTITTATITLQSAPNTATGIPGTWATYAGGTVINGTNPLAIVATPAAGFAWVVGYNPWVRVLLTITGGPATGVVDGAAYGWRIPSAGAASVATQNVNLTQVAGAAIALGQTTMAASLPVTIANNQTAVPVSGTVTANQGTAGAAAWPVGGLAAVGAVPTSNPIPQGLLDSAGNIITPDYCTLKAVVASPGTGNTQLVALSGTKVIRICKISFTTDALTTVQLVTGTTVKTACDTSVTNETAVYTGAGGGVFGIIEDYASPLITTGARNLCIALSAGVSSTGGITIEYSQR